MSKMLNVFLLNHFPEEKEKVRASLKGLVRKAKRVHQVRHWETSRRISLPKLNQSERKQLAKKKEKLATAVLEFTVKIDFE